MQHNRTTLSIILSILLQISFGQVIDNADKSSQLDASLIPIAQGKLYGFVDSENNIVIKPNFEQVSFFNENGLAFVNQYGLYGFINKKGGFVVPPIMRSSHLGSPLLFHYGDSESKNLNSGSLIHNSESKKWVIFSPTKEPQSSKTYTYKKPQFLDDVPSTFRFRSDSYDFYFGYKQVTNEKGEVNYIDTFYNEVLPNYYPNAYPVSTTRFVTIDKDKKYQLINKNGDPITAKSDLSIQHAYTDGVYIITSPHFGSYYRPQGLIDDEGKIIIDTIYNKIVHLCRDYFAVGNGRLDGVINLQNDTIVPFEYNKILSYKDSVFVVRNKEKEQIVDLNGKTLSRSYSSISLIHPSSYLKCESNDTSYVLDLSGNIKFSLPPSTTPYHHMHDVIVCKQDEKYGIVDINGKTILPFEYTKIEGVYVDKSFIVSKDGTSGLFELDRGWVYPLDRIRFDRYSPEMKFDKNALRVTTPTEWIFYTSSLDNVVRKPREHQSSSYTASSRGDSTYIEMKSGKRYVYKKDRSLRKIIKGDQLFFTKKEGQYRILLDAKMRKISPDNYYYFQDHVIDNVVYFIVENESAAGVINSEGKWIKKPKEREYYRKIGERMWYKGLRDRSLLDADFNPISDKVYQSLDADNNVLIWGKSKDSPYIDIFDRNGNLISENTYTNRLEFRNNTLCVEKSPDGQIECCLLDTMGETIRCFPYKQARIIPEIPNYFIVKDLYNFGIVDENDNVIIDFNYSSIQFDSNINCFYLKKGSKAFDFANRNGDIIISDLTEYPQTYKINDEMGYIKSGNKFIFIDKDQNVLSSFQGDWRRVKINDNLVKSGVVGFQNGKEITYGNIFTGMLYTLE